MRKFNLEEAKAGKAVCTKEGIDVKIIRFDVFGKYPLRISFTNTVIDNLSYTEEGLYVINIESKYDLMMKDEL